MTLKNFGFGFKIACGVIALTAAGFFLATLNRPAQAAPATALANWPQAAGPNGTWSVPDAKAPVSWSVARNQNIVWRAPLPNGGKAALRFGAIVFF